MCTGISRGRGVEMRMRRVLRRGEELAEMNRLYMVMAGALVGEGGLPFWEGAHPKCRGIVAMMRNDL